MVETIVEKVLSSGGISGVFIAYLVAMNFKLQNQIENLTAKHEVGTNRTVETLCKLTELISVLKAEVLGKLDD